MDAGSDDTRAKRKQFGVFLCLPMALVLLLIWNGDFGMSPIYGHHGARCCSPVNVYVGRPTLSAMGAEKLIADLCAIAAEGMGNASSWYRRRPTDKSPSPTAAIST
jgi:hypothetical protein